jgi:hypothetical protein
MFLHVLFSIAATLPIALPVRPSAPGYAGARAHDGVPGQEPVPAVAPGLPDVPDVETWRSLVTRNKRIEFPARTITSAQALLRADETFEEDRAAAWLALGAAGALSERTRIEKVARNGTGIERRAAVLALGGMGPGGEVVLTELLEDPEPLIPECALLALASSRSATATERVERLARDTSHPLSAAAQRLIVFAADPDSSEPSQIGRVLFELRWRAAREFGLVDGQKWSTLKVRELATNPVFVRDVILRSAADVVEPPVKDHLLVELTSGEGTGRLRAAVQAMPRETSNLVHYSLWAPTDAIGWDAMLREIDAHGIETLCFELIARATEVPEVRYQALALSMRTGRGDYAALRSVEPAQLSPDDRVWLCDAMAATGETEWLKPLSRLRADPDAAVRCAALLAQFRLGQEKAKNELDRVLEDQAHADHAVLVKLLCRFASHPEVGVVLEDVLMDAQGDEAIDVAAALSRQGRAYARPRVRAALSREVDPSGPRVRELVESLARYVTPEDHATLTRLFPSEDFGLNVELAVALIRLRDPSVVPLLRAALWSAPWDLSCLAGGVLQRVSGSQDLIDEIDRPPPEASSGDLRRVGYVIGEWGGLDAVTRLARRMPSGSGSPVLQGALLGALAARTR